MLDKIHLKNLSDEIWKGAIKKPKTTPLLFYQ